MSNITDDHVAAECMDDKRLKQLEHRIGRLEFWMSVVLISSLIVTALATVILKVTMLLGIE